MNKISDNINYITKYIKNATIIPILSNQKIPAIKWLGIDKTDEKSFNKYNNYAVITGKLSNITVVDIDVKDNGLSSYNDLIKKYGEIQTLKTYTPSGGLHLIFNYNEFIHTTTKINNVGIDIRNDKAIILSPPSKINKNEYKFDTTYEISDIPEWLFLWLLINNKKSSTIKTVIEKKNIKNNNDTSNYNISNEALKNILDKLPNNYLDNYSDWIKIGTVCKSINKFNIFDEWSSKSNKYNKNYNIKIYNSLNSDIMNINWLINKYNDNNNDKLEYIKKIINLDLLHIDNYNISKIEFNQPKLDLDLDIFDDIHNTFIIQSDTGTGKTTVVKKYLNNILVNSNKTLLSIVSRVSLGDQQFSCINNDEKSKFKINMYDQDYDDDEHMIFTVESLLKYNYIDFRNHIVFLDEIHSLLSHIVNSDTINNRIVLCSFFTKIIKEAYLVIACDATISDPVLDFITTLREDKIKYIKNNFKNYNNVKAFQYTDEQLILQKLISNIKNKKKFIFAFDNLKELKKIHQTILDQIPDINKNKILLISSEHGTKKVNVDDWINYDYIFFSPKIIYGCDFTPKVLYDVFLYVTSNTLNCLEISQQMARNRNINEVHFYIKKKVKSPNFDTFNDVVNYYSEYVNLYNNFFNNIGSFNVDKDGSLTSTDNIYTTIYYKYIYYDNIYSSNFIYYFNQILINKGFDIINVTDNNVNNNIINKSNIINSDNDKFDNWLNDTKKTDEIYNLNISDKVKILSLPTDEINNYKNILINKIKFNNHINISKMLKNKSYIEQKIIDSKNYTVNTINSTNSKILLICKFEEILKINRFDINHETHYTKFNDNIVIDKNIIKLYSKMFRQTDNFPNKWYDLYYILIKSYRHICGSHIITNNIYIDDNITKRNYFINDTELEYHKKLIAFRNNNDDFI